MSDEERVKMTEEPESDKDKRIRLAAIKAKIRQPVIEGNPMFMCVYNPPTYL